MCYGSTATSRRRKKVSARTGGSAGGLGSKRARLSLIIRKTKMNCVFPREEGGIHGFGLVIAFSSI